MLIKILNQEVAKKIENKLNGLKYLYFNIDEINPPILVERLGKIEHYNFLICQQEIAKELGLIKL